MTNNEATEAAAGKADIVERLKRATTPFWSHTRNQMLDEAATEIASLRERVKELEFDLCDSDTILAGFGNVTPQQYQKDLEDAESERGQAVEALKPLAALYFLIDDRDCDPDSDVFFQHDGTIITFGHIRAARAITEEK